MTWESQKHRSQHGHGATDSSTRKERKKTWQKKADGNWRWKVKFLLKAGFTSDSRRCPLCSGGDDHLSLKFVLSSLAAAAWQRAPDTRLQGCCSVWHITTEEHAGMRRRRRTRQEWMSTVGKAEEMTNRRLENKWQQFWRNYRPVC